MKPRQSNSNRVSADVEFRPNQLVVRDFRTTVLNVRIHMTGTLDYADYKPGPA